MAVQFWTPSPICSERPCYIVGGGHSLKMFDWNVLAGNFVLGCNAAFYIGANLVPWTIFGDGAFLGRHAPGLEKYVQDGGQVITTSNRFRRKAITPSWLKIMPKQLHGMGTDRLGWNGNTGSSAINLALLLGANPVYLLGYDMRVAPNGESNYHNAYHTRSTNRTYRRFLKWMKTIVRDLAELFPGRVVINLEDNTSALNAFPKESLKGHSFKALVDVSGGSNG